MPDGYAWWYVDALSDDGRHALTLIAFIGSVFSPYYAAARRRAPTDPRRHVALNVALSGSGPSRWAMTERGEGALSAHADRLRIGPSGLHWDGDALIVTFAEIGAPWPRRVRGRVRIDGLLPGIAPFRLDAAGRHRWQPIAPAARAQIDFESPAQRWTGPAYLDANWGDAPLESVFTGWQWCRTPCPDGGCLVRYDVAERAGRTHALRLSIGADGRMASSPPEPALAAAASRWGVARSVHDGARLVRTLEDGPFYARSLLATPWQGRWLPTFHESLSLARFEQRWVQALLPFRMPRRAGSPPAPIRG